VITWLDAIRHRLGDKGDAHRQATADRLGQRHDIGRNAIGLVCPQGAGAPQATLHLIKDQERTVGVAQAPQALQELPAGRVDAALTLHRLHDHRADLVVQQGLHRGQVIEGGQARTGHQGLEGILIVLTRREGQRPHGAPVKGIGHADELGFGLTIMGAGPFAGELDRRLHRFRARVAKVHLVRKGGFHQHLGQLSLRNGVIQVRDVSEIAQLLDNGLRHSRVAIAQGIDRDARAEIEIGLALGIIDVAPLPTLQHKGGAVIGVQDVFLIQVLDLLRVDHVSSLGLLWDGRGQHPGACARPQSGQIGDACRADSGLDGGQCRADLGDHAAIDHTCGDHLLCLSSGQFRHHGAILQHPRHVGEKDHLGHVQGGGHRQRGVVGIHVEWAPVISQGDRRNDRREPLGHQGSQALDIDSGHLAHAPQVPRRMPELACPQQAGIHAGDAQGAHASPYQPGREALVDDA